MFNVLDQPVALDPGGLTRAQWQADPRQTASGNIVQDARKTVRQAQLGNVDEWRPDERTSVTGRFYVGQRDLFNALSTPLAAQQPPTSSGGIVQFSRLYAGFGVNGTRDMRFEGGRALRLTVGVEGDWLRENRQGYVDNAGQQGALKRDERNTVGNLDLFGQAAWDIAPSLDAHRRRAAKQRALSLAGSLHRGRQSRRQRRCRLRGDQPGRRHRVARSGLAQSLRQCRTRVRDADLHRARLPPERQRSEHAARCVAQPARRDRREVATERRSSAGSGAVRHPDR